MPMAVALRIIVSAHVKGTFLYYRYTVQLYTTVPQTDPRLAPSCDVLECKRNVARRWQAFEFIACVGPYIAVAPCTDYSVLCIAIVGVR